MAGANPTARALLCLQVLLDTPGITAARLADRLDVSDRAARRYVAILREAGIPVESVRGPYGGYRLGRGLRLPPLMFTTAEALGLVMAVLEGHHDAADARDPVGGALGKLLRARPEPVARQAEAVRRTTASAPDRGAVRPDPQTAASLVQASADRHRVRIGYRSDAGSQWSVAVDPLAVVVRHGRWYLLCWSHRAHSRRAYRVDRVTAVEVLDATFAPPADLDPVADLEAHLALGWAYDVEVVIDAPIDASRAASPAPTGSCGVPSSRRPPASSGNGCLRRQRVHRPDLVPPAAAAAGVPSWPTCRRCTRPRGVPTVCCAWPAHGTPG